MTHAAFDDEHRLTTDKITKRIEGKVATEVALYQSLKYLTSVTINLVYQISAACSTGSYSSILSVFQSNVVERDVGVGQAGNVKKRGRREGRGPADYNMLPGSTHGLMDEGRIFGKEEHENGHGSRNGSKRENADTNTDNDDEVTITLSAPLSPIHKTDDAASVLSPSSSSSSIDDFENGKTTYSFLPNTPTAHTDIEVSVSSELFFKAEGINVLCGDMNLFSSDGLMLQLKR